MVQLESSCQFLPKQSFACTVKKEFCQTWLRIYAVFGWKESSRRLEKNLKKRLKNVMERKELVLAAFIREEKGSKRDGNIWKIDSFLIPTMNGSDEKESHHFPFYFSSVISFISSYPLKSFKPDITLRPETFETKKVKPHRDWDDHKLEFVTSMTLTWWISKICSLFYKMQRADVPCCAVPHNLACITVFSSIEGIIRQQRHIIRQHVLTLGILFDCFKS